jgi:sortase A
MPLYRYVKAEPKITRARGKQKLPRYMSLVFITIGTGMLLWVAWPILSFIFVSEAFYTSVTSPLADMVQNVHNIKIQNPLTNVLSASTEIVSPYSAAGSDNTNPNTWFPGAPQKKVVTPVNAYMVSVPKLKIDNATVIIGGDDLNDSLIHYGGTGLPGDYGNAVIFGHSTLPQLYNPKKYKTIFSLLPSLKEGDTIYVTFDGVRYRYEVYEMKVTEPSDLSPLEQTYDDSYITLVTCVPPGTYWKRLYVKAKLLKEN